MRQLLMMLAAVASLATAPQESQRPATPPSPEAALGQLMTLASLQLQLNQPLGAWVPKDMTELWETGANSITGIAQYERFQRLTVSTAEIIK